MAASSSSSSTFDEPYVDDFYFSALHDEDEIFPISDEKYAEELQLQEALFSSSSRVFSSSSNIATTDLNIVVSNSKGKNVLLHNETGNQSSQIFCGICMDTKQAEQMFSNTNNCHHFFCTDCVTHYVASKLQENMAAIKCPALSCTALIAPELCRSIVPQQVFDRWENALCESIVLGSQKFYCPFKDCSAMLIDDGGEIVTSSECPNCRRLFCAQCKVGWHNGIECREFQKLNKDERQREDIMLMELAKNKKWRRCPRCKFYVEKNMGCLHISCRCGCQFCYGCGKEWTSTHACGVY